MYYSANWSLRIVNTYLCIFRPGIHWPKPCLHLLFLTALYLMGQICPAALAQTTPVPSQTPSLMGPIGLNLTPSARFDKAGTVSASLSTADPYSHLVIGTQITDDIYIGLRQTAEISKLTELSDELYPGMDLKLRLLNETTYIPAIALGLQSAFGHKRMAGEYIVASKRFGNFDLSGGAAWGRLGSAAHISNPLGIISGHFDGARALDGDNPNDPGDWFTGKDIGFFAGIEYALPHSHFSFNADWGADRYVRELAAIDGFTAPDPWSISLDYHPADWINANIGVIGGDTVMGRITLRQLVQKWPGKRQEYSSPPPVYPFKTGDYSAEELELATANDDVFISRPVKDGTTLHAKINLTHAASTPKTFGRLMRHAAFKGGAEIRSIHVTPVSRGLEGRRFKLFTDDIRRAIAQKNGSPEEIWHNADISEADTKANLNFPATVQLGHFILEQDISLAEEDSSLITRTSLFHEAENRLFKNIFFGTRTRVNLGDNLERLNDFAFLNDDDPVRSDINRFADQQVGFDRIYLAAIATPYPDLHLGLAAGYLEEVYSGIAGEVLYRPFGKTFAAGVSMAQVRRRDPATTLNFGLESGSTTTGHLNLYYELPNTTLTLDTQLGRFLAGDWGGSFGVTNHFANGAKLRGFVTATNESDQDVFGGDSNFYSGIQFTLPIGNAPFLPNGSQLRTNFQPIGRDKGQKLHTPLDLYSRSEAISYRHIRQNWPDIIK